MKLSPRYLLIVLALAGDSTTTTGMQIRSFDGGVLRRLWPLTCGMQGVFVNAHWDEGAVIAGGKREMSVSNPRNQTAGSGGICVQMGRVKRPPALRVTFLSISSSTSAGVSEEEGSCRSRIS